MRSIRKTAPRGAVFRDFFLNPESYFLNLFFWRFLPKIAGFYVVAVGIEDEGGIVVRSIIGAKSGRAVGTLAMISKKA